MSTAKKQIWMYVKKGMRVLQKREKDIAFGVSLVLVAALAFFGGVAYEEQGSAGVMVIEKPVVQEMQSTPRKDEDVHAAQEGKVAGAETVQSAEGEVQSAGAGSCLFVGSKNSNKYHSPSCSYAKRIKPENVVCFHSKEEAESKGYVAGCIK